jgi:pimeloyl-ACP methyl ester carboxylesterase
MQKRFIQLKTGEILYRKFGQPGHRLPVVLLHPSPLSSAFLERLGTFLEDELEVFAPDLPGYGLSKPPVK